MTPYLTGWWMRWRFGLALGGVMIAFELLMSSVMLIMAPQGAFWLGATAVNHQDVAVYLNYLAQGKDGFLITNFFNDNAQPARFDSFWSIGGLLVRSGLSPIIAHELLRWLCTLILGCSLYAAAKSLYDDEHKAKLAAAFAVSGFSLGWLYTIYMASIPGLPGFSSVTPDVDTEFAVIPLLLGGAHMILSLALQLWILRWTHEVVREGRVRSLYALLPALVYVSFFHPYFLPLYGIMAALCAIVPSVSASYLKRWSMVAIITCAMLPGGFYFAYIMRQDSSFAIHHLQQNVILLAPWRQWVFCLMPIIAASLFLTHRKIQNSKFKEKNSWIWLWMISAAICLMLPMTWERKYTQGILPAMILVTFPFWSWLKDKSTMNIWGRSALSFLIIAPILHFLAIQYTLNRNSWRDHFYQTSAVGQAWEYIRKNAPPDAKILARDQWVNIWTPGYAERHVWIGQYPETPDYERRGQEFVDWLSATNTQDFNEIHVRNGITHIMSLNATDTEVCASLFDPAWQKTFESGGVAVWTKR